MALQLGVGRIVVDSASEITRLAALVPEGSRQQVMVRVVPGIEADGPGLGGGEPPATCNEL